MVNKITIGLLILALLVVPIFYLNDISEVKENKINYQGPVPEGYDLNHFRETGITKMIGAIS